MNNSNDFNAFVTREGEIIPLDHVDRVVAILADRTRHDMVEFLWDVALWASDKYPAIAQNYFQKILELAESPLEKAECLLEMGKAMERARDYKSALEIYVRAFEYPQEPNQIWYFLNNNLGFCLNLTGQHREAEQLCRAAIGIDPDRHNAHKNLGIALQGLGRLLEAAGSFIAAAELCPDDPRALFLLDRLIEQNPDLLNGDPDLTDRMEICHDAVGFRRLSPAIH